MHKKLWNISLSSFILYLNLGVNQLISASKFSATISREGHDVGSEESASGFAIWYVMRYSGYALK